MLYSVKEDKGVLCLEDDGTFIEVPIRCLPEKCRVGDVFEVNISFNPFETLKRVENCIKDN